MNITNSLYWSLFKLEVVNNHITLSINKNKQLEHKQENLNR